MKVAIVGTAPSHVSAPYHDPSFEVWSLNDAWKVVPRADRWFDLHSPFVLRWGARRPRGHLAWLARFAGPVYLHAADPDIPTSVAYPLAEVVASIGQPYLTSGPAYMLALAIHERADQIMLCGVDLTDDDYRYQRPCVEWLIGLAMGRGIPVLLPSGCPLLSGPLYGRPPDRISPNMLDEREHQLAHVIVGLESEYEHKRARVHELKGGIKAGEDMLAEGLLGPPLVEHLQMLQEQLEAAELDRMATFTDLASARGALQDTRLWQARMSAGTEPDSGYARSLAEASDGDDARTTALRGEYDG